MKTIKKAAISRLICIVACTMVLTFSACTSDAPFAPQADGELHFIPLGPESHGLAKVVQSTQFVTQQSGGTLSLQFKPPRRDSAEVQVIVTLVVLPHTISEDAELSLSLDDQTLIGGVDVTFQPHGITFSRPAILNIQAKGLDLSGTNPEKIDIYYDNPDSGQWEKMARKQVIVKPENGFINVVAAEIPHFSRYAVGWSR